MKIFVPKEAVSEETRVPLIPDTVKKLTRLGAEIQVESGLGASIRVEDSAYQEAGAEILTDRMSGLKSADMVLRLNKPTVVELSALRPGALHVSYLDPLNESGLVRALAEAKVSAVSIEMIPRTTIAQKMDALSSQANLGGYVAVILAAEKLETGFPMMMTPSGTLNPARVFIIGAGVAGLQAIATAKRLGARVEAFDTRPVVEEQVKSLGAKFVKIDLGETGQTKDGYAKQLTPEQLEKQREGMAKRCAASDVVITTAQVFGRKAPLIMNKEMVSGMKPGSVVVDMAVETGGNVEGSKVGEVVELNGVRIIGYRNLPGRVPVHASQMYSSNLYNFIEHFWDKEAKCFQLDREDEIIQGALITHEGEVVNKMVQERMN